MKSFFGIFLLGCLTCSLKAQLLGGLIIPSPPAGEISSLNCSSANNIGSIWAGISASGVSSNVPYTGGNGGTHIGQTVNSTDVTGLTATLASGIFANGGGNLIYTITGTPSASGIANFVLNIGGQSCILRRIIQAQCLTVNTVINDVVNPSTGRTWMDRNLGARQIATSSIDPLAFGDLYQWGRGRDGHQCRNSTTTTTLSSTNTPSHGNFITVSSSPNDWRSPQNDNLWQGVNGVNNPCPTGYRLPTSTELNTERLSWVSNNSLGAFTSPLKFTLSGARNDFNGIVNGIGMAGQYWSSTVISPLRIRILIFESGFAVMSEPTRSKGFSIRCIKN